jgi:hypothetical protein
MLRLQHSPEAQNFMTKIEWKRLLLVTGLSWVLITVALFVSTLVITFPKGLSSFAILAYGLALSFGVPSRLVVPAMIGSTMVLYAAALLLGIAIPYEAIPWLSTFSFFVHLWRNKKKEEEAK